MPGDFLNSIKHVKNLRVGNPVKNIPALTPILDQSSFPENSQLLGDIRLTESHMGFQMAYTVFSIPQDIQDINPGRVGKDFEDLNLGVEKLIFGFLFFNHIQYHEYDYSSFFLFVKTKGEKVAGEKSLRDSQSAIKLNRSRL
jgi:hypothetical protein